MRSGGNGNCARSAKGFNQTFDAVREIGKDETHNPPMGARSAVVKGGHRRGPATDVLYDGSAFHEFPAPRIRTPHTHGTGCTYSAALACGLARNKPLETAVADAKEFVTRAIRQAFAIGAGHGPVHHFHRYWTGDRSR